MPPSEFYQVGGYRGHFSGAPETIVAKLPIHEDGIDLVLGITHYGASYLLLPKDRLQREVDRRNWPRDTSHPLPAGRFASLSPIHFVNSAVLQRKLKALSPKANKKKQHDRDTSQANSKYTASGEEQSPQGEARASFEHQRVFVALRLRTLRERELPNYAVQPVSWLDDIEIVSFAHNKWIADSRTLEERERDPKVLDVGWASWAFVPDTQELRAESTTHLFIRENSYYLNKGVKKLDFEHGESETISLNALCTRLQNLFPLDNNRPRVLLVHKTDEALALLRAFGVLVTSRWHRGISDLLKADSSNASRGSRGTSPPRRPTRDPRQRPRSPPRSWAQVYVVDVRDLQYQMMQQRPQGDTVASNAMKLKVEDVIDATQGSTTIRCPPSDGWCAGNECRLLARMWFAMACGPSIDEQYELRSGSTIKLEDQANQADPNDSDVDPNDMVVPAGQNSSAAPVSDDPYAAALQDDDDDW